MLSPTSRRLAVLLLLMFTILLVWSSIRPRDPLVWFFEIIPAIIGIMVMIIISPYFLFTNLVTIVIFVHCLILLIGAHYTYPEVPFFNELRDLFHSNRNNYDKLGHLIQGCTPVLIAREVLIRLKIISRDINKYWLPYICISIALSISALYELSEWAIAVAAGADADAFLGTQGYVWDVQSDILYCLIGAIVSLILFTNLHNRYLSRIEAEQTKRSID